MYSQIYPRFLDIQFVDSHHHYSHSHCVYRGKNATVCGLKLQFDECLAGGAAVKNGAIGADTKLIFRSRSCRWFWLIQV